MRLPRRPLETGFTLVELVIVIVVLGIVSVYAVMKSAPIGELNVPSQAQTLASDMRHAQTLAYTLGRRMKVTILAAEYSVTCFDLVTPCPTTYSVALNAGLAPQNTLVFDSLGRPNPGTTGYPGADYTVGGTHSVAVAQLTGLVTVSP